jgi:hypothetical protein
MAFIRLAYAQEIDGKQYAAEDVVEVDRDTASNLLHKGLARKANKSRKQTKDAKTNQLSEDNDIKIERTDSEHGEESR